MLFIGTRSTWICKRTNQKYSHAKHADICMHFWFGVSAALKICGRKESSAAWCAVTPHTHTVIGDERTSQLQSSFAFEKEKEQIFELQNHIIFRREKIQDNFQELKTYISPEQANPQQTVKRRGPLTYSV